MREIETKLQKKMNEIFPLLVVAGLLLAAWGLIITPDEMHSPMGRAAGLGWNKKMISVMSFADKEATAVHSFDRN